MYFPPVGYQPYPVAYAAPFVPLAPLPPMGAAYCPSCDAFFSTPVPAYQAQLQPVGAALWSSMTAPPAVRDQLLVNIGRQINDMWSNQMAAQAAQQAFAAPQQMWLYPSQMPLPPPQLPTAPQFFPLPQLPTAPQFFPPPLQSMRSFDWLNTARLQA